MTLPFQYLARRADGDELVVAGTGIRVYALKRAYEAGASAESLAANYEVPLAGVFEALAYAHAHAEEMEAIRDADEQAERRSLEVIPASVRPLAEESIAAEKAKRDRVVERTKKARLDSPVP